MAGTVVTIGNFDGVHAGHAALLRRARAAAAAAAPGTRVVALCFDPHPATVLRPGSAPPRLSTFAQRSRWLLEAGADEVLPLEPSPALLGLGPEDFVHRLVAQHRPAAVVEGPDFRFGRGRAGDVRTLAGLGARLGFAVHVVEPVSVALLDQSLVVASSSVARWLVARGRVGDAARVLGRAYELEGVVVPGDRRGRRIGFPTANLSTESLPPGDGVYAAWAHAENGLRLPAAVSVGDKPTFAGSARAVEAFLLRGDSAAGRVAGEPAEAWTPLPGLPEYGWRLRLEVVAWLRDQARFDSVPALVDQMARDSTRARAALGAAEPAETAGVT